MPRKYLDIPQFTQLPAPVYFRHDEFVADTHSAVHQHAWGQLNYTAHGVMQLEVAGQRFLSPPHYAVWVPPDTAHGCYNPQAIVYRSIYLHRSLCAALPPQPCSLMISDILKAILGDFARRDLKVAEDERDQRLVQVLLDQLLLAPAQACYLPFAQSDGLRQVLDALSAEPGDNRPLADWPPVCMLANAPWPASFCANWASVLASGACACVFCVPSKRWRPACPFRPLPSTLATAALRRSSPCSSARPSARPSSTAGRRGRGAEKSCYTQLDPRASGTEPRRLLHESAAHPITGAGSVVQCPRLRGQYRAAGKKMKTCNADATTKASRAMSAKRS